MKLLILISILLTGCATSRSVNYDFSTVTKTVARELELELAEGEKSNIMIYPVYFESIEVTKYVPNKKLELKGSSLMLYIISKSTKIKICRENDSQSKISARHLSGFSGLLFPSRNKETERNLLNSIEDQLNEQNQNSEPLLETPIDSGDV